MSFQEPPVPVYDIGATLGFIAQEIGSLRKHFEKRIGQAEANLRSNTNTQASAIYSTVVSQNAAVNGNISINHSATQNVIRQAQSEINSNVNQRSSQQLNFLQELQMNILRAVNGSQNEQANAFQNVLNAVGAGVTATMQTINTRLANTEAVIGTALSNVRTSLEGEIQRVTGNITKDLEGFVNRIIEILRSIFDPLIAWFNDRIDEIKVYWKGLENKYNFDLSGILQFILAVIVPGNTDLPKQLKTIVEAAKEALTNKDTVKIVTFILLLLPNAFNAMGALFKPFSDYLTQQTNVIVQPKLPPEEIIIRNIWQGDISPEDATIQLLKYGYSQDVIRQMFLGVRQLLGFGELRTLYHRGAIRIEDVELRLSHLGFGDKEIDYIKFLLPTLPPLTDTIRFAVREAYDDSIVTQFGLDEDFPIEFAVEAAKQGLDSKYAQLYWRSHWTLPSVTQAFEMFHRGVISQQQLKTLLRTQDFSPFWRDKLEAISYALPTRVDIRRMYFIGQIDRQQVYDFYRKSGYDHETAEGLTRFTELEYAPEDSNSETSVKGLTRSAVEQAYLREFISRDEAMSMLTELNYSEEAAELFLDLAEFKASVDDAQKVKEDLDRRIQNLTITLYTRRTLSRQDAIEQLVTLKYTQKEAVQFLDIADIEFNLSVQDDFVAQQRNMLLKRIISPNEFMETLVAFGFTVEETNRQLELANLFDLQRDRQPSLTQLRDFVRNGILTLDQWRQEMQGLGYAEKYITMFAYEYGLLAGE